MNMSQGRNFLTSLRAVIVTVEYDPTGAPKTAHDHEGQEFDYVLTGHMKIVLAGNEVYLGPGDSIYYDSSIPHAMYAVETVSYTHLDVYKRQ